MVRDRQSFPHPRFWVLSLGSFILVLAELIVYALFFGLLFVSLWNLFLVKAWKDAP